MMNLKANFFFYIALLLFFTLLVQSCSKESISGVKDSQEVFYLNDQMVNMTFEELLEEDYFVSINLKSPTAFEVFAYDDEDLFLDHERSINPKAVTQHFYEKELVAFIEDNNIPQKFDKTGQVPNEYKEYELQLRRKYFPEIQERALDLVQLWRNCGTGNADRSYFGPTYYYPRFGGGVGTNDLSQFKNLQLYGWVDFYVRTWFRGNRFRMYQNYHGKVCLWSISPVLDNLLDSHVPAII